MFRLSYSSPYHGEVKKIKVNDPWKVTLGSLIDAEGKRWNVHGTFGGGDGKYYCWAEPEDQVHPYYGSTMDVNYGLVQQSWRPHELVKA
jgi:hypothetical protein